MHSVRRFIPSAFLTPGALVWLLCFVLFLTPVAAQDKLFFAAGFCALAGGLLVALRRFPKDRNQNFSLQILPLLLGLFTLNAFVAAAASEILVTSYLQACFLSVLPLGFFYFLLQQNRGDFLGFCKIIVPVLVGVLSSLAVLQYAFFTKALVLEQAAYPFADPNLLGAFLSLGWFFTLGVFVQEPQHAKRLFFVCIMIVSVLAMIFSGSRAGLASLVIFAAVFACITGKIKPALFWVCLAMLLGFVAAFLAFNPFPQWLSERLIIWYGALTIIIENPFLGTGPGTFFWYYPEVRGADFSTAGQMAHNDPLQFWAEMGAAAPLVFYVAAVTVVYYTHRVWAQLAAADRGVLAGLVCGLGALALHAHVNFNFYALPVLFLSGTMLGCWQSVVSKGLENRPVINFSFKMRHARMALAAVMIIVSAIFISFQGGEIMLRHARAYLEKGNAADFVHVAQAASTFSMNQNGLIFAQIGAAKALAFKIEKKPIDDTQAAEIETDFARALALNPRLSDVYAERAALALYRQNGAPPYEAIESDLRRALALNPAEPQFRVALAKLLLLQHKNAEAAEVLRQGLLYIYPGRKGLGLFVMSYEWGRLAGDADLSARALLLLREQGVLPPSLRQED